MTDAERQTYRDAIVGSRIRTAEQIDSLRESFRDIVSSSESTSTDDEHDPEGATIAYERAQVASLIRKSTDELASLDLALSRIDGDELLNCENCQGDIALSACSRCPTCAPAFSVPAR